MALDRGRSIMSIRRMTLEINSAALVNAHPLNPLIEGRREERAVPLTLNVRRHALANRRNLLRPQKAVSRGVFVRPRGGLPTSCTSMGLRPTSLRSRSLRNPLLAAKQQFARYVGQRASRSASLHRRFV